MRGSCPDPPPLHHGGQAALIHECHDLAMLRIQHISEASHSWYTEDIENDWVHIAALVNEVDFFQDLQQPPKLT